MLLYLTFQIRKDFFLNFCPHREGDKIFGNNNNFRPSVLLFVRSTVRSPNL